MKKQINTQHLPIYSILLTLAFITLISSCSKGKDDPSSKNGGTQYCGKIEWKNTIGLKGYFDGEVTNNRFYLTTMNLKDDVDKTITFHYDANHHILNDQTGFTFTYDNNDIIKIVMLDKGKKGSATFNFDKKGHSTSTEIENSDDQGSTKLVFTYTYDQNGDPVIIKGHGEDKSNEGTTISDYLITANYLTDKANFLPPLPEMTPFTVYFAYHWYLSSHLIDKWQIHIAITLENGTKAPPMDFTQQYTYTYDANGRVATMVHTGNSKNIYTFNLSGCK